MLPTKSSVAEKTIFKARRKSTKSQKNRETGNTTSPDQETKSFNNDGCDYDETWAKTQWLLMDGKKIFNELHSSQETNHYIIGCLRNFGICYGAYNFLKRSIMMEAENLLELSTDQEENLKKNQSIVETELLSMIRELKQYYVGFSWGITFFQNLLQTEVVTKQIMFGWSKFFVTKHNDIWSYNEIPFPQKNSKKIPFLVEKFVEKPNKELAIKMTSTK